MKLFCLCLWPCAEPWQLVAMEAEPDVTLVGGRMVSCRRWAARRA